VDLLLQFVSGEESRDLALPGHLWCFYNSLSFVSLFSLSLPLFLSLSLCACVFSFVSFFSLLLISLYFSSGLLSVDRPHSSGAAPPWGRWPRQLQNARAFGHQNPRSWGQLLPIAINVNKQACPRSPDHNKQLKKQHHKYKTRPTHTLRISSAMRNASSPVCEAVAIKELSELDLDTSAPFSSNSLQIQKSNKLNRINFNFSNSPLSLFFLS